MTQEIQIPADEIACRTGRIQQQLQASEIGGLFLVQKVDIYYFTGDAQSDFLYIPAEGEPILFAKAGPDPPFRSPLRNIIAFNRIEEVPSLIHGLYGCLPETLGFEWDVLPVRAFDRYRGLFPDQTCVDGSPAVMNVRMKKSPWEISRMESTGELFQKTFEHIRSVIRPGYTEMEFAGMVEAFAAAQCQKAVDLKVRDYLTEGYPWHILSGESGGMIGLLDSPSSGEGLSAASPCGAGNRRFQENEPIMIDFNYELNGYHMDVTRMFAIGSMPDEAMKASEAAIEIHNAVLEKVGPGVPVHDLFQHSVKTAEALGYGDSYLGPPGHKVTFIGHGIGLELVEPPIMARGKSIELESGMTFALEPKLVFQDRFVAGVESVCQVTDDGYRLLSDVPLQVFIC